MGCHCERSARAYHINLFPILLHQRLVVTLLVKYKRHESVHPGVRNRNVSEYLFRLIQILGQRMHVREVVIEKTGGTAESCRLCGHAVLHPPARNEDRIRKILAYLAVVVYEHLVTGIVINESVAAVTRNPGTVRNKRHVDLVILVQDCLLQLLDLFLCHCLYSF